MKNKFYNDFDCARMTPVKREVEYRTSFQIDRDRIIHSSEFRRLQGKTQVFLPGEYDFYRTRLTHTIEVAQIARSIVNYLTRTYDNYFGDDYFIDPDLVEAAALAHDLGHPPFGHAGERTLNRIMAKYGGFEGNAQTLRLITETFYRSDDSRRGMNPTRAFLDGILKYKSYFTQRKNPHNHFIYDYQKRYVTFAFGSKNVYNELTTVSKLNSFRSIECQIMDWADDTAYAVNDIADSISGGFISMAKLIKYAEQNKSKLNKVENEYLDELIDWIKWGRFKARLGSLVGEIIRSSKIKTRKTFMDDLTNRYKYELVIDSGVKTKIELYKKLAVELVFRAPQLHQVEFKGDFMIENMFAAFENNYIKSVSDIKLFSTFSDDIIRREKNKMKRARLVCDQLSGMTDSYANKNYKRLFDPDFSSLADLV